MAWALGEAISPGLCFSESTKRKREETKGQEASQQLWLYQNYGGQWNLRVHLWMVSSGCLDAAPVFSVAGGFFGTILQKSGTPLLWDLKDYGYVNNKNILFFHVYIHSIPGLRQKVIKCYLGPFEKPGASLMMLPSLGEKCVTLSMKDLSLRLSIPPP